MAHVILCVCLNPALDITYQVPALKPGEVHRAAAVFERAGGKGLNVARVLHQLGEQAVVTGFAGGANGAALAGDLDRAGIAHAFTRVAGSTRRSMTVVDPVHGATVVNEPGPTLTDEDWRLFLTDFEAAVVTARAVVCSGSLPPGLPDDAYGQLTERAHRAGARVVVDAHGPALLEALAAGPDVVKPNAEEAGASLGTSTAVEAAAELRRRGARVAIVTMGASGVVLLAPDGTFTASGPAVAGGNPTGAGDAFAASVAVGLLRGRAWPRLLTDAVALAAGAVAAPLAGEFDAQVAAAGAAGVKVEELS